MDIKTGILGNGLQVQFSDVERITKKYEFYAFFDFLSKNHPPIRTSLCSTKNILYWKFFVLLWIASLLWFEQGTENNLTYEGCTMKVTASYFKNWVNKFGIFRIRVKVCWEFYRYFLKISSAKGLWKT